MDLYHVIYTSSPAKRLSEAELENLLDVAREANARFEVTGILVCLPDSYIQLIEGPRQHIEQLYQNIQRDQRHFRVTTLREGPLTRRYFPDWAMAFKRRDANEDGRSIVNLQDDKVLQLFDIIEAG